MDQERVPVIAGVGEVADHPAAIEAGLEPAALMVEALRRAEAEAGARLLAALDSLDIINEVSWPYRDPVARVCGLLGHSPRRAAYGPVGGQTPVAAIHTAALRIAARDSEVAAVCGAEAAWTVAEAARARVALPWPDHDPNHVPVRSGHHQKEAARRLGISTPTAAYPLYENATTAAWGQSPAEALAESATLWSGLSAVAAEREAAWLRRPVPAREIATPSASNRPVAWPYTKLTVANPTVNQGAAVLLTSLARARRAGVPEERLVHVGCGAAASEPEDILARAGYDRAPAMEAVLAAAVGMAGGVPETLELYSCFPCVPKMARRVLGLGADAVPSVTGGLTFFGAPLNNYMSHAAVAMVRSLRGRPGTGLLYGQGGYVTRHHALLLSSRPSGRPPTLADVGTEADAARGPVPPFTEAHEGPATLETFTVLFGRDGAPTHGVAVARTGAGARLIARVAPDDTDALALLMDAGRSPVGLGGTVRADREGRLGWRFG